MKKNYYFKILENDTFRVLNTISPSSKEMVRKVKAGNFFFINNNFYFKNELVRMDPDDEDLLYRKYDNLINLTMNEQITFNSPLPCYDYNRLIYFKKNEAMNSTKTAIILPFLDQRFITLNKQTRIT